jgi:hypothetical protein
LSAANEEERKDRLFDSIQDHPLSAVSSPSSTKCKLMKYKYAKTFPVPCLPDRGGRIQQTP